MEETAIREFLTLSLPRAERGADYYELRWKFYGEFQLATRDEAKPRIFMVTSSYSLKDGTCTIVDAYAKGDKYLAYFGAKVDGRLRNVMVIDHDRTLRPINVVGRSNSKRKS